MNTRLSVDQIIPLPAFQDNYIWLARCLRHAVVVDPGDAVPVLDYLAREELVPVAVLITHHHNDHTGGIAALTERFPELPVIGPADDPVPGLTRTVRHGDRVVIDEMALTFDVIGVPGHTRGHIAFHAPDALFCGDTLFAAGCGRLFEGDAATMLASLDRLAALPDDTLVCCAHEYTLSNLRFARFLEPEHPQLIVREADAQALRARGVPTLPTRLGLEKATNPFLRSRDPALRAIASRLAGSETATPAAVFAALREAKNNF